jgi:hypothetical protein
MEQFILSNFSFGLGSILIGVVGFVILNLGLVIFLGSKNVVSRAFAFMNFVFVLWILTNVFSFSNIATSDLGTFLGKISYAFGLFPLWALSYCCFVQITKKRNAALEVTYFFLALIFTYFIITTNYIISESSWFDQVSWAGVQIWSTGYGPLISLYYLFYSVPLIVGLVFLNKETKKEQDLVRKKQFRSMFWIIVIGVIPPTITSIVLPGFHIVTFDWIGGITGVFWIAATSYFLLRKNQTEQVFPVLIVKTELIVIAMIFLFGIGMFY